MKYNNKIFTFLSVYLPYPSPPPMTITSCQPPEHLCYYSPMTENTTTPTVKRKPGGQPGNRNAFKHGLRSRKLTPIEREQFRMQILLTALEQAAGIPATRMSLLDAVRQGKQLFVGDRTIAQGLAIAGTKGRIKMFVSIEPSPTKGLINLKTSVVMPLPEILSSQAKLMDSIHQIKFSPRTTNESPPPSRI